MKCQKFSPGVWKTWIPSSSNISLILCCILEIVCCLVVEGWFQLIVWFSLISKDLHNLMNTIAFWRVDVLWLYNLMPGIYIIFFMYSFMYGRGKMWEKQISFKSICVNHQGSYCLKEKFPVFNGVLRLLFDELDYRWDDLSPFSVEWPPENVGFLGWIDYWSKLS